MCRDKPEVEMQMAGNSTGEGGKKQLDVRVSEISLMSMSTLPLFRDNVFCQVEVGQDVSNPQFGGAAKLYQRTKSVSSTSNDKRLLPPWLAWHMTENCWCTVFKSTISASWVKGTTPSNYPSRH